jgi:hypothetical protein
MCDLGLKTMAVISASHPFAESSRDDNGRVGPAAGRQTRQTQAMPTISGLGRLTIMSRFAPCSRVGNRITPWLRT